jgi:hypothetical protein
MKASPTPSFAATKFGQGSVESFREWWEALSATVSRMKKCSTIRAHTVNFSMSAGGLSMVLL